jgi:trans-aconitate 2-methyltransferase
MVAQARRNHPHLRFEVADARDFAFPQPFDGVLSNAVLHWIRPPEPVVACVRRALKPSGRFVAEFGGRGNVRMVLAALERAAGRVGCEPFVNPWYFPSVAEYADLLEAGGLEVTYAVLFDRPTPLEGEAGLRHWVEMFAGEFLEKLKGGRREEFMRRVEEEARPALYRDGTWFADYRRLRVVAGRVDP